MTAIYDPNSPSVNPSSPVNTREALRAALLEAKAFSHALAESLADHPVDRPTLLDETDQVLANFAEEATAKALALFEALPE